MYFVFIGSNREIVNVEEKQIAGDDKKKWHAQSENKFKREEMEVLIY